MSAIHLDNIAAGMVLGKQVCDVTGRVLLPEGVTLSEKHVRILRTWGILEVEVIGDSDRPPEHASSVCLDPARVAAAEAYLRPLFVHNDLVDAAVAELFRVCVERKAKNG